MFSCTTSRIKIGKPVGLSRLRGIDLPWTYLRRCVDGLEAAFEGQGVASAGGGRADALARGQLVRPSISHAVRFAYYSSVPRARGAARCGHSAAGSSLRPGRVRAPACLAPRTQDVVRTSRRAHEKLRKSRKAYLPSMDNAGRCRWGSSGESVRLSRTALVLVWVVLLAGAVIARGPSAWVLVAALARALAWVVTESFFIVFSAYAQAGWQPLRRLHAACMAASSDAGGSAWLFVPWWGTRPSSASPRSPASARVVELALVAALGDTLTLVITK